MQNILSIITPILTFMLGLLSVKIQNLKQTNKESLEKEQAMLDGMRSLLRGKITDIYYESKEQGYCRLHRRGELEDIYEHYKALGGNGVITDLHSKTMQMPTDPTEERTSK